MEVYYLVDGERYIDTHILRDKLDINRSELQYLMKNIKFPQSEIIKHQNRNLYSEKGLRNYIEMILKNNER